MIGVMKGYARSLDYRSKEAPSAREMAKHGNPMSAPRYLVLIFRTPNKVPLIFGNLSP